jgi:hypothetical protein
MSKDGEFRGLTPAQHVDVHWCIEWFRLFDDPANFRISPTWEVFWRTVKFECEAVRAPFPSDEDLGSLPDALRKLPEPTQVRLARLMTILMTAESEKDLDTAIAGFPRQLQAEFRKTWLQARPHVDRRRAEQLAEQQAAATTAQLWGSYESASDANVSAPALEWLPLQTPDTWHAVVAGWGAGDKKPLEWIATQSTCDKTTAAVIFFLCANGGEYVRYPLHIIPEYRQHCWRLCETIARNWQAGFYKTRQFTFPEQCDALRKEFKDAVAGLRATGKPVPWTLPEDAFAEFDGREPKSIYTSNNGKIRYAFEFWRLRHDKPTGATQTASTTLRKLFK